MIYDYNLELLNITTNYCNYKGAMPMTKKVLKQKEKIKTDGKKNLYR